MPMVISACASLRAAPYFKDMSTEQDPLSDEAAWELAKLYAKTPTEVPMWLRLWQECARRADKIIDSLGDTIERNRDENKRLRELLYRHISFISAVGMNRHSLEYDALTLGIQAMDFLIITEKERAALQSICSA